MNKADFNPFESLQTVVATDSRDWARNRNDAWIYGIICGWDDDSLTELAGKFNWSDQAMVRLKLLHKKFVTARERQ